VRDRGQAVGGRIAAGQNREYTWRVGRRRDVDPGVRVRRAQDVREGLPGRLKSFAYGLGPSADAHPRAAERICRCLAEKVALGNPETTLDAMSWTTSDLLSPAHVSWGKTFRSASWT